MPQHRTRQRSRPRARRGVALGVVLSAALLAGCSEQYTLNVVTRTDSAGITIVTSTAPAWSEGEAWTIVPEPATTIGALDGPPESQLYRVADAARLADGRVVVANRGTGEIRIYGADGGWIRSMGGEGEGPGEFRSLTDFQLRPPDTLLVRDPLGSRLTRFSLAGDLLGTRRLPSPTHDRNPPDHRLPDGRWLVHARRAEPEGQASGQRQTVTSYGIWEEGDEAIDTLVSAPTRDSWGHQGDGVSFTFSVPYGGTELTAIGPDGVAVSSGERYDIAVATLDGDRLRVRRPFDHAPVTEAMFDDYVARFMDQDFLPPPMESAFRDAFGRITRPTQLPSHSELHFDAAGNLWVEHYRPREAREDTPRVWSVHDPDGAWLGDVVLPNGLRVLEIGEDYILGVETDELDVEYVRVYEIEKGGAAR